MMRYAEKLTFRHLLQEDSSRLIETVCYRKKLRLWIYVIELKNSSCLTASTFSAE